MFKKSLVWLFVAGFLQGCFLFPKDTPNPNDSTTFLDPIIHTLDNRDLIEVSGIAPSQTYPGFIYAHEDNGGRPNRLHLISNQGKYNTSWVMPMQIRNWEDIAVGPGPVEGKSYVYLGNIGDNQEIYPYVEIFRFEEPSERNGQIDAVETIRFKYSDERPYDAETLLLNPKTKDIYIITKRQFNVRVYKLAYPQKVDDLDVAQFLFTMPYPFMTGGDISVDGKEILLKNYDTVYYWRLKQNETLEQALQRPRDVAPRYLREPMGESICFDLNQSGFFTVSETGGQSAPIPFYFYPKK